jgi:DNA-binding PadR family transcriptional regulator
MSSLTPDHVLLGLLAAEARHGYQLLDVFRDPAQLGAVWNLSTSQLYAVLKRLERDGLIAGERLESEVAPARVEFALTAAGHDALAAWLHDSTPSGSIRRVRVEFLSRLFIARLLNTPTAPIVARQKRACMDALAAHQRERDLAAPGIGLLATDLVIAQLEAVLTWIDRCEMVDREEM